MFDAADENDISLADVLDNAPENAPANESELDNLNDEHQDEDKVLDEGAVIPFEHNEEIVCDHRDDGNPQGFASPSGEQWGSNKRNIRSQLKRNILRLEPGIRRSVNPSSLLECFMLYLEDSLPDILRNTNLHGRRITRQSNQLQERHQSRKQWLQVIQVIQVVLDELYIW